MRMKKIIDGIENYDLFKYYLKYVIGQKECEPLSKEKQIRLGRLYKKGDKKAGEKLVESNLRLVVKMALNYVSNNGCDIMDIIQEGNKGLLEALLKYEPERNVKFNTFAAFFIKKNMSRFSHLDSKKGVYIPHGLPNDYKKILKFKEDYYKKHKNFPSVEIIAEKLNMRKKRIPCILNVEKGVKYLEETAEDESPPLIESIYEQDKSDFAVLNKESINNALEGLCEKERRIIELYFELNNKPKTTLTFISKEYNITYQRVQQIKKRALKKLKNTLDIHK